MAKKHRTADDVDAVTYFASNKASCGVLQFSNAVIAKETHGKLVAAVLKYSEHPEYLEEQTAFTDWDQIQETTGDNIPDLLESDVRPSLLLSIESPLGGNVKVGSEGILKRIYVHICMGGGVAILPSLWPTLRAAPSSLVLTPTTSS